MALNLNGVIDVIEKPLVAVSAEMALFLAESHKALKGLPGDRAVNVDPGTAEDVKEFIQQARSWAEREGKRFTRVGDIKGKPLRVSFRVVTKRTPTAETPESASGESASAPATAATASST